MNRGANRQAIYRADADRHLFLDLLAELSESFRLECHAYCLMDTHYHLLIHTPMGQLGRAMRHLSGLYTQRINRLAGRDGPLFRGRYKAILIDADTYLLAVSRYIHLNPLLAGIVPQAEAYAWSSYPAYVGLAVAPAWLSTSMTLQMAGTRRPQAAYRDFVERGVDKDMERFYGGSQQAPILGDAAFEASVATHRVVDREIPDRVRRWHAPTLEAIVGSTAAVFGVASEHLLNTRRGRGQANPARQVALYLSRELGGYRLGEIASYFGLSHYASVSRSAQMVRERIEREPTLAQMIDRVQAQLGHPQGS
jgi:REP element-mobilizing transposase RayT